MLCGKHVPEGLPDLEWLSQTIAHLWCLYPEKGATGIHKGTWPIVNSLMFSLCIWAHCLVKTRGPPGRAQLPH